MRITLEPQFYRSKVGSIFREEHKVGSIFREEHKVGSIFREEHKVFYPTTEVAGLSEILTGLTM
jgi:hypothetical protein